MLRYELIVFDWDGTLMDSAAAIVRAIQLACHDLELPAPPDALARQVIGLGLADALSQAVPALSAENYCRMVDRYRAHYLASDHELGLFDGVVELLDALHAAGHQLAVATGKSRLGLDRALAHCGLASRFAATRCADECHSKPHPQMLEELMREFAVEPHQTLMIGDTSHDLLMAQNAGVDAVGVTYGAHAGAELAACRSLVLIDDVAALSAWLSANA